MAIFSSDVKDVVKRLSSKEFSSNEERDELLKKLGTLPNLRARELIWMLFRHDRAIRDSGIKLLQKLKDSETVDAFLAECKSKPEAAIRAAAGSLFTLGLPAIDARLAQLASGSSKEANKE